MKFHARLIAAAALISLPAGTALAEKGDLKLLDWRPMTSISITR
jgi:hypothetical protein